MCISIETLRWAISDDAALIPWQVDVDLAQHERPPHVDADDKSKLHIVGINASP